MVICPLAGRIIRNQTDSFSACPMGSLQLLGIAGVWTALPVEKKFSSFLLVEGFLYPRKVCTVCSIAPSSNFAGSICIIYFSVYDFFQVFSSPNQSLHTKLFAVLLRMSLAIPIKKFLLGAL